MLVIAMAMLLCQQTMHYTHVHVLSADCPSSFPEEEEEEEEVMVVEEEVPPCGAVMLSSARTLQRRWAHVSLTTVARGETENCKVRAERKEGGKF